MVPIAGKYIALRSAAAVAMIEFLRGTAAPVGTGPAEQLQALRVIADRLSTGSSRQIEDPVDATSGWSSRRSRGGDDPLVAEPSVRERNLRVEYEVLGTPAERDCV